MENEQEIITNAINEKALKDNIKIIEYNILKDHIHIIILTEKSKLENIVRDFKGYSAFIYFKSKNLTKEGTGRKNKLWAKHYNISFITSEENYINAIEYVKNNKIKHQEKENLLKNK